MTTYTLKLRIYWVRILFILGGIGLALLPISAWGVEFTLDSPRPTLAVDQPFAVSLFINTRPEVINAFSGIIQFSTEALELQELRDGNSIVNFWVDRPAATSAGQVTFSGIIPGGYEGEKGLLLSLIFKPTQPGLTTVSIKEPTALLHDGAGTPAPVSTVALALNIARGVPGAATSTISLVDTNPPELFTPAIAREAAIFDNKWFVVFATQDKGSGIDHYEIHESKRKYEQPEIDTSAVAWRRAVSPAELADQTLRSYIYVKAIDRRGNEWIAIVAPAAGRRPSWYTPVIILAIIVVAIMSVYLGILWKRRKILYTKTPQ